MWLRWRSGNLAKGGQTPLEKLVRVGDDPAAWDARVLKTVDKDTSHLPHLAAGNYISVAVSDAGHGIPTKVTQMGHGRKPPAVGVEKYPRASDATSASAAVRLAAWRRPGRASRLVPPKAISIATGARLRTEAMVVKTPTIARTGRNGLHAS